MYLNILLLKSSTWKVIKMDKKEARHVELL